MFNQRSKLKFGCKVRSLFQNDDHVLQGRVFSINMDSRTISILYDHGIFEDNIPMHQSKFIILNESLADLQMFLVNRIIIFPNGISHIITQTNFEHTHVLPLGSSSTLKMETNSVLRLIMKDKIIQLRQKGLLFSFPKIIPNTHHAIIYDYDNSGKVDVEGYDGPCSGHSIIFSQITGDTSQLDCTIIHRKTTINELPKNVPNHFIVNTNLHSLTPNCCGALIAYAPIGCKSTNVEKKEMKLRWQLGILCYHSLKHTVVVSTYLYHDHNTGGSAYYLRNNSFSHFDNYKNKVSIKYLNHLSTLTNTVNGDNVIHMKIEGPDIIVKFPFTSTQKKMYKNLCKEKIIKHPATKTMVSLCNNHSIPTAQLNTLFLSQVSSNFNEKNTICYDGCTIINITSPKESLVSCRDSKLFMLPLDVFNKDGFDSLQEMTYVFLTKHALNVLLSFESLSSKEYVKYLQDNKQGDNIRLKIIDPKKMNSKGVLLHYIESQETHLNISPTYNFSVSTASQALEHCQYAGTILSHWYTVPDPNTISITQEHIELMHEVYGCTGFGSRSSISSIGFNVYTGIKNNSRAIANPATLKEDNVLSQINRSKFKDTYNPLLQSVVNSLTTQASYMFPLCDRLYNLFLLESRNRMQYNVREDLKKKTIPSDNNPQNIHAHRGPLCVLSILTMGKKSTNSRIDGFTNHPHIDHDIFCKEFQGVANTILNEWIELSALPSMTKNLHYIKRLHDIGHKQSFPLPTSCGYRIVENTERTSSSTNPSKFEFDESKSFISFALIGLGTTIRIRSNLYHFFYASIVSHCTPVPVTVMNDRVYTFTGLFDVVGWGASSVPSTSTFRESSKKRKL